MADRGARGGLVRLVISGVLELLGLAAIVWGCSLIAPFLGFIIGGVGLMFIGLAVDPPAKRQREEFE